MNRNSDAPTKRQALHKNIDQALQRFPQGCYNYSTLSFTYVWKTKSNKQIALMFNVSERTLAHIRSKAVHNLTQRLR